MEKTEVDKSGYWEDSDMLQNISIISNPELRMEIREALQRALKPKDADKEAETGGLIPRLVCLIQNLEARNDILARSNANHVLNIEKLRKSKDDILLKINEERILVYVDQQNRWGELKKAQSDSLKHQETIKELDAKFFKYREDVEGEIVEKGFLNMNDYVTLKEKYI